MQTPKIVADNRDTPNRLYRIDAQATEATMYIYDVIGEWGISARQFVRDFAAITADTIHLRINSPGGSVDDARAIAAHLKGSSKHITAHVDGLAASAAAFLTLAADTIEIQDGAFLMVHNPWTFTIGNAEEHDATAAILRMYGDAIIKDYVAATGQSEAQIREWFDAETWFTAAEALEAGLVDAIAVPAEKQPAAARWNLAAYTNVPTALASTATPPTSPERRPVTPPLSNSHTTGPAAPVPLQPELERNHTMNDTVIPPTPPPAAPQLTIAPTHDQIQAAIVAERERHSDITRIGEGLNIPAAMIQNAIANGVQTDAFRIVALEERFRMDQANNVRVGNLTAHITRDQTDTRRDLMQAALLHRINGHVYRLESGNEFTHFSMLRMAEASLTAAGIPTRSLNPNEVAIQAMQKTADFPALLENSLRKVLLDNYAAAEPTYKIWARGTTTPDFKLMSRVRRGEMPALTLVAEGDPITVGTIGDSKEVYAIATYGRGIALTRQAIINDDLQAFNDLAGAFGVQAARIENRTVYAVLTSSAPMGDTMALFDVAHLNSGTGIIDNDGLNTMFETMAMQKGIDGQTVLNLVPKFLIVHPGRRMTALASQRETGPSLAAAEQNQFAGMLTVVSDAELPTAAPWYGSIQNSDIEYCHLAGAEGPQFIRQENADGVLGLQLWCYIDFGAKAVGWKGLYRSDGIPPA